LAKYLVGTGSWSYFKVPGKPSLKAYSEVFNFVEVNCTFYEYPNQLNVEGWRRTVPPEFVFSVRCHQDLTHRIGFKPVNEAFEVFYKMKAYCDVLRASFLVLETPASQVLDINGVRMARDFFSSVSLGGVGLVWEYRAPFAQEIGSLMQDFGIVHSVDLSLEEPGLGSDVVYSRLFGKGRHNIYQFTDDELVEIDRRAEESQAKTVVLAYHGVRMNIDALRFRQYKLAGKFLPVTGSIGVDSAKSVLAEDAAFPSTKQSLISNQGWKVIDLTAEKRVHLSELLSKLPEKTYSSLNEVVSALENDK
jgi:uncharacterized protein YecE (DUF72 family)